MKKSIYLILLTLVILPSCEYVSYREWALPEYDGELEWTNITKKADWPERYDHAAVAYDNKLWIAGGYNPGQVKGDTYYEDVWSSPDGENWTLVTADAPWKGRRGHELVAFDDGSGEAMYLIGGFTVDEESGYRQFNNDVWKSEDGINWTEIKPRNYLSNTDGTDWIPRMYHKCVIADHGGTSYIYLTGGRAMMENKPARHSMLYFSDVWRSTDGMIWEKLAADDYGMRALHASAVDPATGRIYIQGGTYGVIIDSDGNRDHPVAGWQKLWYSDDGINWISESNTSVVSNSYLFRQSHQMVFYKDKLWSLPGATFSTEHYHFTQNQYITTWTYAAGDIWNIDSEGTDIDARHGYSTVLFNNKIWVLGGFTNSCAQSNDVWCAE